MIHGETHQEQMVSRLIPRIEFADTTVELHDGRCLVRQDFWRVQIGRYPISYGPHSEWNIPIRNVPMDGSRYVIWGFFETQEEALEHASNEIRHEPWFYEH